MTDLCVNRKLTPVSNQGNDSDLEVCNFGGAKGLGLVASRGFKRGQIVLEEEALVSIPLPNQLSKRCHLTLLCGEKLLRCSKSKLARYLGRQEQAQDWKLGFREEAIALQHWCARMGPKLPPTLVRLCCRLEWRVAKDPSLRKIFDKMPDHLECLSDDEKQELILMARGAHSYLACAKLAAGEDPWGDSVDSAKIMQLARHLAKLRANAHNIVNGDQQPIGIALFGYRGRLVNHADLPNTVQIFKLCKQGRPRIILVATKEIAVGDEITISYVDQLGSELQKEIQLKWHYNIATSDLEGSSFNLNSNAKDASLNFLSISDDSRCKSSGLETMQFATYREKVYVAVMSPSNETNSQDLLRKRLCEGAQAAASRGKEEMNSTLCESYKFHFEEENHIDAKNGFEELIALFRDPDARPSTLALFTAAGYGATSAFIILAQRRMQMDIENGKFEHALACGALITKELEVRLPSLSPALAIHYAMLAKLYSYFDYSQDAQEYAGKAVRLYSEIFGGDNVPRLGDQLDTKASVSFLLDLLRLPM